MNKFKITFCLTTRNDGYGGIVQGMENMNFAMKRLEVTCESILALGLNAEIIITEYAPLPEKEPIKKFIGHLPVRIITIDRKLHELLIEENKPINIPFYEYIAKHIGIMRASSQRIIACNPDNIFPVALFDDVICDIDRGKLVRADRYEINRNCIKHDIPVLIEMANKNKFEPFAMSTTAGGDFIGFKKQMYEELGGYDMVHGNWGVDNALVDKARGKGIAIVQNYKHYHIDHDNARIESVTPTNTLEFKPISKEILKRINDEGLVREE